MMHEACCGTGGCKGWLVVMGVLGVLFLLGTLGVWPVFTFGAYWPLFLVLFAVHGLFCSCAKK